MSGEDEEYANAFAYALLTPKREVAQRVNAGLTLTQLAVAFGVQASTMQTRLEQLGLWDSTSMVPKPRSHWGFLAMGFHREHGVG